MGGGSRPGPRLAVRGRLLRPVRLPGRTGLARCAGQIEAGPPGPRLGVVPRPRLTKLPGPVRRNVQDVRDFAVGFSGAAQVEGAPDRFGGAAPFAPGPAGALPGAVGGLVAVRPKHGPALGARPRRRRVLPPPLEGFPKALGLDGYLLDSLAGDTHLLADQLQGMALLQQRPGPGPPGRQAYRPTQVLRRPQTARRPFAPFGPASPHAASRSSSASTASPMAEQETGCWPWPAMSAVRTPAASTFPTAPSTRSASSPMSKL